MTPFNTEGTVLLTAADAVARLLEYDSTGRGGLFNQITATRKCRLTIPSEPEITVVGGKRHVRPTNTTVDAISFVSVEFGQEPKVRGAPTAGELARLWQQGWTAPIVLARPLRLIESVEADDRAYLHFVEASDVELAELFKVAEAIRDGVVVKAHEQPQAEA